MTDNEKLVWKTTVIGEMKEHLKIVVNYPTCTNEMVMAQVPYMWNLLVAKKLTLPGMSYEMFHYYAHQSYMKAEVNRIIGI